MVNATISVVAMVNARLGTTGDTNEAWPKASGQRRLVAATLADYADPARCHADSLCLRVHAMEPTMPIAPKLADGIVNPCIETKDGGLHNPVHLSSCPQRTPAPASCPTSMCRPRLPAERAPHRRLAHVR